MRLQRTNITSRYYDSGRSSSIFTQSAADTEKEEIIRGFVRVLH